MAELAAAASGAGDQGDERRAKVRRIRRLLDEAERPALRRARPYEPSADPLEQLRRVALLEGVPDDSEDDAEPADAEARVRSSLRGRVWKVLLGDGDEIDPARYAQLTEAAAEEARREAAASERGGASPGVSHAAARDTETRAAEDARADETSIAHDATRTFRTDTDFWRHPSQREAQLRRVLSTYAFVARGRRRPAHGEACDISSTGVDGAASGGGDCDGHDDDASDRSGRCYVQGMNAVCGPLIYVMPEADAFSALGTLLSKMCPRYFESNLAGERARGAAREPSPPPLPLRLIFSISRVRSAPKASIWAASWWSGLSKWSTCRLLSTSHSAQRSRCARSPRKKPCPPRSFQSGSPRRARRAQVPGMGAEEALKGLERIAGVDYDDHQPSPTAGRETRAGGFAALFAFPLLLSLFTCCPPLRGVMRLWDALFAFGVHLDVRHTHTHPAPSLAKSRGPEIARQVLLCVAHIMLRRDALLSDRQVMLASRGHFPFGRSHASPAVPQPLRLLLPPRNLCRPPLDIAADDLIGAALSLVERLPEDLFVQASAPRSAPPVLSERALLSRARLDRRSSHTRSSRRHPNTRRPCGRSPSEAARS